MPPPPPARYIVSVRELCEFAAKRGDLDLRFTPSPTAQEGQAGHATVAGRREPGHQAEVWLTGDHESLTVRGRADGYDAGRGRIEEVKTFRGELARMPDNHRALHWAQLKVYAALVCRRDARPHLDLALVYFDVDRQQETAFDERHEAVALERFFIELCERFTGWAAQELVHRAARDEAWAALAFPHAAWRAGQRPLAEAVYRAAQAGRCLLAQAPTGIGKTLATLFPLLKAAPRAGLDKIWFLTAKEAGRQLAIDAMSTLACDAHAKRPRVLELVARTKACEHPDKACHGEACPLARGFYDRLPAARAACADLHLLDRATVRRVAAEHSVCPYYLTQELCRWADVVIGDYNHYFDVTAILHGLQQAREWRVALLVDEAHNLVERAREMYTAELSEAALRRVRKSAPAGPKKAFTALQRTWKKLAAEVPDGACRHADAVPQPFESALRRTVDAIGEHFAEAPAVADADLLQCYFDLLAFTRLLDTFGPHSSFDIEQGAEASVICLRNVLPAPFLTPRFAAAHTTTLFSATLTPADYYARLLGLPDDTVRVDVESPFKPEQLQVKVAADISTRWQHRDRSVAQLAKLIAQQYAERPGNYLAFFSSFDYLGRVADAFNRKSPDVPTWRQAPAMDADDRASFLARFTLDGRGIGFATLGGSFGEAIDLPGTRLIGAFVATLGLPPPNPVNEHRRERMQAAFGAGYDYAYLYPGLQKVVQAAGRVIRSVDDRGVIVLIDDRYATARVRRLLPAWWPAPIAVCEPEPREAAFTGVR